MNLSRALVIVCCLSPLILVVSYGEPVQSAGNYYDSLDPAGEEIVACNFYRKGDSDCGTWGVGCDDTTYREAQTYTITKNLCDNLANQNPPKDPRGNEWDADGCFSGGDFSDGNWNCDVEHNYNKIILSNSGFVGSKSGEGPVGDTPHHGGSESGNWDPWKGWAVKTPPACPYDISKMSGSDWDYCRCGDKNHRISDGGKCTENGPHPEERLCEDLQECGDYELKEVYNWIKKIGSDEDLPLRQTNEISPNTVDIAQGIDTKDGRFNVNTWLYVSEEKENVGIDSDLGDASEVSLSKLDLSSHTSSSDTWEFEDVFSGEGFTEIGNLEKGWYLMEVSWTAGAWSFDTEFSFTLEGGDVEIGEIAETVNWKGPIPIDLNRYNDPDKAKEACENHPYFGTDFSAQWAQTEWESVDDKNRLCCGNKGSQDYGTANPVTDETCTSDGWSDEVAKCYDGGSPINGTHFSPELDACCGAAAGDEGDGSEEVFKSCEVQNSDCSVYTDSPVKCEAIPGCNYNFGEEIFREETDDQRERTIDDPENPNPVNGDCEGTIETNYCVGQDESICTSRTDCNAIYETEGGEEVTDNYGKILEIDQSSDKYSQYACLKNKRSENNFDHVVENDSTWHVWRNANDTKGFETLEIMTDRVNTHYVSDDERWYTCDAGESHSLGLGETTNTVSRDGYEGQAICSEVNNQNVFRECCTGGDCSNSATALYQDNYRKLGQYFVEPGQHLNSILIKDKGAYDVNPVEDQGGKVINTDKLPGDHESPVFQANPNNQSFVRTNWSGYDELEMIFETQSLEDVLSDDEDFSFTISNGQSNDSVPVLENSVNLGGNQDWHKFTVDLDEIDIDKDTVVRFAFNTQHFFIYDIYLKEGNKNYCGDGEWVSSLNESEQGCNTVPGYDWTGNMCCGSNTLASNQGELYADDEGACGYGEYVGENELITDTVLYYEGEAWGCDTNPGIQQRTDGENNESSLVPSDNVVEAGERKGEWTCSLDGTWLENFNDNRMSFLVTTMNQIGEASGQDYTLHCGVPDTVANNPQALKDNDISKMCSLTLGMRDPQLARYSEEDQSVVAMLTPPEDDGNFTEEDGVNALLNQEPFAGEDPEQFLCDGYEGNFSDCQDYLDFEFYFNKDMGIYVSSVNEIEQFENAFPFNPANWWSNLVGLFSGQPENVELDTQARGLYVSRINTGGDESRLLAYHDADQDRFRIDYQNIPDEEIDTFIQAYSNEDLNEETTLSPNQKEFSYTEGEFGDADVRQAWKSISAVTRLGEES